MIKFLIVLIKMNIMVIIYLNIIMCIFIYVIKQNFLDFGIVLYNNLINI